QRDARYGVLQRLVVHLGLQAAVLRAATADAAADAQPRPATVEQDDLAGIDQVRVADLVAVQPPHLGPAPRFTQEAAGDAPQRVAADDGVAVRGVGSELRAGLGLCAARQEAREGD